ncbi:MAG: hypothetical protein K9M11_00955 [Candidatus Pacebacteria bacterium]|nr:hypothetical protein [Candidatus Paceibacterota bacterium]
MDLLFISLEQVCIAIGAGSAFIFTSFFILSLKNHIIKPHEYVMLKSLSLFSLVSAFLGLICFIINTSFYLESAVDFKIGLVSAKLIIFSLAFLSEMTLRKIHLPTLMRHQKAYFHLSNTMLFHQDPLVATATFSLVSWVFIIFLSALDFRGISSHISLNFVEVIVSYIIISYTLSKLAIYFKEKTL